MSALSAVLLILSFQFRSAFFHVGQPGSTATYLVSPSCDGYRMLPKVCVDFLYGAYRPRGWFWIDSNGKMETLHPVEDHLVVNSRRSVIIAELWRREVARRDNFVRNFCAFLDKRTFSTPTDVVVFKFREIWPTGHRWNRALFSKQKKNKNSLAAQTVATARIAPKCATASTQQCTQSVPDFIQIGSLSMELKPNAWTP